HSSDGFNYDLVDVTRQVLANYALPLQRKWVKAYQEKNTEEFELYSGQYLQLISDMDRLLASRKDFLLGPWIADARSWGTTAGEKALYERNARDLITLWGDAGSPLHEYANRQWSGLLNDFYKVRWQKFFGVLTASLRSGKEADLPVFEQSIKQWEWQWVNSREDFPVQATGNPVTESERIYQKYHKQIGAAY
ncbi:MAG TPA: alpha-N-acetylglucosaminidase C-terminal domain-containing protein, partial [Mucilaginibacter sp.]|nr:alpha-N-acetylglucosaminidase C-terminal domain-containing protein [Mucilaginibacter sp.]